MKTKLPLLFSLCCTLAFSQVGIGTTDPKATLHIEASEDSPMNQRGLILPTIHTLPENTPEDPIRKGLLVYYDGTDELLGQEEGLFIYVEGWKTLNVTQQENILYTGGELYVKDPLRDKFLSSSTITLVFSEDDRRVDDKFLTPSGGTQNGAYDQAGYLMPFDCTVVFTSIFGTGGTSNMAFDLIRIRNGEKTVVGTFELENYRFISLDQDIDFDAGDILQYYVRRDGDIDHPQVILGFKRRL
jgi:hypothetical protein